MVERIVLSLGLGVIGFGILWSVPRLYGDIDKAKPIYARAANWPDFFAIGEQFAQRWLNRSRWFDVLIGILGLILLAAGARIFLAPSMIGGSANISVFSSFALALLGLLGLGLATYLNVRRSGLSSAEAFLIGSSLNGIVLLVLVIANLML